MSPPEIPQTSAAARSGRVREALTRQSGRLAESGAGERERAHWSLGETVILRGHEEPTGWLTARRVLAHPSRRGSAATN